LFEKKWQLKNPVLITALVLVIVDIVLIFFDNIVFNHPPTEYISGVITEIIGIVITIIFVQIIFDKKSKEDLRSEELKKIIRANKIIELLIERYALFLHCMIHDHKTIAEMQQPSLNVNFKISDMQYLHESCLLMKSGHLRSSVSLFYENELELRNLFISLIQNIDFEYFPEISIQLLDYINTSYSYDSRGEVLNNEKMFLSPGQPKQKLLTKHIQESLKTSADDYMEKLLAGKASHSNLMFPYVSLYYMIIMQKKILINYEKIIKKITKK
jgi:uncharacterized membrane protein